MALLALPKMIDLNIDSNSKKIAKTNVVNKNKDTRTNNKNTEISKSLQKSELKELNKHKKEALIEKTIEPQKNKSHSPINNNNNLNGRINDILVTDIHEDVVELSMGIVDKKNDRLIVNPVIDNPEILDLLSPTF